MRNCLGIALVGALLFASSASAEVITTIELTNGGFIFNDPGQGDAYRIDIKVSLSGVSEADDTWGLSSLEFHVLTQEASSLVNPVDDGAGNVYTEFDGRISDSFAKVVPARMDYDADGDPDAQGMFFGHLGAYSDKGIGTNAVKSGFPPAWHGGETPVLTLIGSQYWWVPEGSSATLEVEVYEPTHMHYIGSGAGQGQALVDSWVANTLTLGEPVVGGDAFVTVVPASPTVPGPPGVVAVGDTITITNTADAGNDDAVISFADVTLQSLNGVFSVPGIAVGNLPAGSAPAIGTVAFTPNPDDLLTGTYSAVYDVTIDPTGSADDSGPHTWSLQAFVQNAGGGSALVGPGGSYGGLGSTTNFASVIGTPTVATILAGVNSSAGSKTILMDWREPGLWYDPDPAVLPPGDPLPVPADLIEPAILVSNVLKFDIVDYADEMFVLQMTYDQDAMDTHFGDEAGEEIAAGAGGIFIAYKPYEDPFLASTGWTNAAALVGDGVLSDPLLGLWQDNGSPVDPGVWGVDTGSNTAWVVLGSWLPGYGLPGEFAVVPEPGSMVLLLTGLLGLVFYLRRRGKT